MNNTIPDYNIFMVCPELEPSSLSTLSALYHIRNLKPQELKLWKTFPFDTDKLSDEYNQFMDMYILNTYSYDMDLFYNNTLVVCGIDDVPIATCTSWKIYNQFYTIQWFKTKKEFEGQGIGRALLSAIMKKLQDADYPIYLHTQLSSYRAIKLYSDFGFLLILADGKIGSRLNELNHALSHLKELIPKKDYDNLTIVRAPADFVGALRDEKNIQF